VPWTGQETPPELLDEFRYRFNRRRFGNQLFSGLLKACVSTAAIAVQFKFYQEKADKVNMAYSIDYREAAIAFERAGHIFAGLKEAFEIVPRTYCNWLELKEETGLLEAREAGHRKRKTGP
jgi:hypothetical protein